MFGALYLQLVWVFRESVESLGGRASLEDMCQRGFVARLYSLSILLSVLQRY